MRQTKEEKQEFLDHGRYVQWLSLLKPDEAIEEIPDGFTIIPEPIPLVSWSPTGVNAGGVHEIRILIEDTEIVAASSSVGRLVYLAQQERGERRTRGGGEDGTSA